MPIPDLVQEDELERDLWRDYEDAIAENVRHIVCPVCYPAFSVWRVAPHDAECICGKPVKKGDFPAPDSAPDCGMCKGMSGAHYRSAHRNRRF
jgi:hypothetical protein